MRNELLEKLFNYDFDDFDDFDSNSLILDGDDLSSNDFLATCCTSDEFKECVFSLVDNSMHNLHLYELADKERMNFFDIRNSNLCLENVKKKNFAFTYPFNLDNYTQANSLDMHIKNEEDLHLFIKVFGNDEYLLIFYNFTDKESFKYFSGSNINVYFDIDESIFRKYKKHINKAIEMQNANYDVYFEYAKSVLQYKMSEEVLKKILQGKLCVKNY